MPDLSSLTEVIVHEHISNFSWNTKLSSCWRQYLKNKSTPPSLSSISPRCSANLFELYTDWRHIPANHCVHINLCTFNSIPCVWSAPFWTELSFSTLHTYIFEWGSCRPTVITTLLIKEICSSLDQILYYSVYVTHHGHSGFESLGIFLGHELPSKTRGPPRLCLYVLFPCHLRPLGRRHRVSPLHLLQDQVKVHSIDSGFVQNGMTLRRNPVLPVYEKLPCKTLIYIQCFANTVSCEMSDEKTSVII